MSYHGVTADREFLSAGLQVDDIHPFYADLLNVLYDRDHYKLALGQLAVARNLIDRVASGEHSAHSCPEPSICRLGDRIACLLAVAHNLIDRVASSEPAAMLQPQTHYQPASWPAVRWCGGIASAGLWRMLSGWENIKCTTCRLNIVSRERVHMMLGSAAALGWPPADEDICKSWYSRDQSGRCVCCADYVRLLKYGDSLYRCKELKRAALVRVLFKAPCWWHQSLEVQL